MRVVHVISGLDRQKGGVVMSLIGLSMAQVKAGLDVTILSSYQADEDNRAVDELRTAGVKVIMVGPVVRALAHWSKQNRPAAEAAVAKADIAHIHGPWEDIYHQVMKACRRQGKPYVVSPHGMLSQWSMRLSARRKRLYLAWRLRHDLNRAAAIHYTTPEEVRQVAALGLVSPQLIEKIGVDLEEFRSLPPAGTFRAKHPEIGGRPFLLFLGRLTLQKGLDALLPAFARADVGDAKLVLAGPVDPEYRHVVDRLIDDHNLKNRVLLPGMLRGADRVAALVDADLFVLTSYHENFGIVVLEALAAGTPALISDRVNFADYMHGQGVGEVVPRDVNAIATALTRWMSDPALRESAGARARPFALENFNWLDIAQRWESHYAAMINSRTSAAGSA